MNTFKLCGVVPSIFSLIIFLQCSKTCGGGIQRRTAKCIDDRNTPIDDSYCNNSEMITEQICNTENCPVWTLADTSSVRKKKTLLLLLFTIAEQIKRCKYFNNFVVGA